MSSKFIFVGLLVWGAFLTLVGTFGGKAGYDAAGTGAAITVTLIVLYGFYNMFTDI